MENCTTLKVDQSPTPLHSVMHHFRMMSPVNWKHRRKLPSSIDGKNRMLKMLNAISIVIWRYFSVRFFCKPNSPIVSITTISVVYVVSFIIRNRLKSGNISAAFYSLKIIPKTIIPLSCELLLVLLLLFFFFFHINMMIWMKENKDTPTMRVK